MVILNLNHIQILVVLVVVAIVVSVIANAVTSVYQEKIIRNQQMLISQTEKHLNQTADAAFHAAENRQLILDNRDVANQALRIAKQIEGQMNEIIVNGTELNQQNNRLLKQNNALIKEYLNYTR